MLKTGVEIDPLTDQKSMILRRDFSVGCVKSVIRKLKPTISICGKIMIQERPSNFINCLDANNLYGLAMSMNLPIGKLKWIKKILTEKMVMDWNENDDNAYILEVSFRVSKGDTRRTSGLPFSTGKYDD